VAWRGQFPLTEKNLQKKQDNTKPKDKKPLHWFKKEARLGIVE